jgi:hypothetical protein
MFVIVIISFFLAIFHRHYLSEAWGLEQIPELLGTEI